MALTDNWLIPESEIDQFLVFAQKYKDLDLSSYKKSFLSRRLKARFDAVKADNLTEYIQIVSKDSGEWQEFLDNLCINVSEFFRDQSVFLFFKDVCVPELIRAKEESRLRHIRCWSCGCSCGEEPYSVAMVFREVLRERIKDFSIKIFATDIDRDALSQARRGEYKQQVVSSLAPGFVDKYFDASGAKFKIKECVREMVVFQEHNLFSDEPLKNMDVVFLRNVRIYFSGLEAESVLTRACVALKRGGYMVLGKVETVGSLRRHFEPVSLENKIFRRV